MSEQMLTEDATISEENKSSVDYETPTNSDVKKFSRKRRKTNQNGPNDNIKSQELLVETSIKSNCEEQSEVVNAAEVDANACSKILQSNACSTSFLGKRKKQKNGQDTVKRNGTEHDRLKIVTSMDGTPLEGDVCSQPFANKCLKLDDIKHDAEPIVTEDMSPGQQETMQDVNESNNGDACTINNCHDPQIGDAVPVPEVKAINFTCKQDVSSVPNISEQLCFPPICVNFSSMNNLQEHVDADNMLDEKNSTKTYARKRQKDAYSQENSLVVTDQGASSLLPEPASLPKGSRNTCLNCPDKAHAPGCLMDVLKQEKLAGHDNSTVVGDDSLLEKPLGVSSDIECASTENTNNLEDIAIGDGFVKNVLVADLAGANYEHAERSKQSANLNVPCGMHSVEEKMESSEKVSSDGSTQIPPVATLDQKIQPKVEDSLSFSSELGLTQVNATQPMNQSSLEKVHSSCSRKKLLVLDVNGLLADIVPNEDLIYQPDAIISSKAVFKRPFCDDFLKFCFEKFDVGVWSSRTKKNVQRVLDFLIRRKGYNLLFCWDQSHCTETGYNTIENKEKPLVLKELKKLWEKQDPDLPWESGDYDESNTLLLDDSPYKALRNPPNTAIFPYTYAYWHKFDNALAARGHLRMYLERLAEAENVQKYLEKHPFGQRPITKISASWPFYLKIIGATSTQSEADVNSSLAPKPQLEAGENSTLVTNFEPEVGADGSLPTQSQPEAGGNSCSVTIKAGDDSCFSMISQPEASENNPLAVKSQSEAGDDGSLAIKSQSEIDGISCSVTLEVGDNSSSTPKAQPEAGQDSSLAIESQPETADNSFSAPISQPEASDNSSSVITH